MICDIYDNVLEQNDAEEIQEKMSTLMWGYDYKSNVEVELINTGIYFAVKN